ncbi:hypothetical protein BpHYR1_018032 [Brachionus plicatilis]|uniref:Uncharacterized protein n=1 Tax=Brachionus plicatilis TaxID=10195 RepID=A0A3M7SXQ5_BRAPC|nr:hypothetical protein BpHYR1_018032 [Brachionus plicatilis]
MFTKPFPSSNRFTKPVPSSNRFTKPVPFSNRFPKPVPSSNRFTKPVPIWNRFPTPTSNRHKPNDAALSIEIICKTCNTPMKKKRFLLPKWLF